MFTASSAQSPRRLASNHHQRGKPYGNKVKPGSGMVRSGSILGTIKNIVAAPLSWFSGGEKFEDLGKRRRGQERDLTSDDEDGFAQKTKRIRVSSPVNAQAIEPTASFLDPPASSLPPISMTSSYRSSNVLRKSAVEDGYNRSSSVFGGQSLSRTMSIDPPAQYAIYHSDPSMVPLPMDSPMESRLSMSAGPRDLSMRPSASPLRLRTSLTPQPSPAKPIRREASAPPPLSSLMSRPVFVRPPPTGNTGRELKEQKTVSLGSLAEYNRFTRSPSRDRMLTSLSSIPSVPSSLSNSTSFNARFQTPAEKTFHELEMYKTPIIPSRYKDSKAIPDFLKPKKVHVPIPMSRKERETKPSLGMASKGKSKGKEKAESKPYAGESGISKLLAKRQAEVEERSRKYNAPEDRDEENEEVGGKRDVGVYAKLTSESEGESTRKKKQVDAPIASVEDPFDKQVETTQGGRRQPYGRVGRARRENPIRVVKDARPVRSNRYSATFDDEDEDSNMDNDGTAGNVSKEPAKKPAFEAPAGFTFANAATTLQLDHSGAKEPPISSLPFSLTKPTEPTKSTVVGSSPVETAAKVNGELKAPTPPSFFHTPESVKIATTERTEEAVHPPKLEIVPPTPEQSTTRNESGAPSSSFFAAPPTTVTSNSSTSSSAPSVSSGIPNFFASSAVLAKANNKPLNDLTPTTGPSPAATSSSVASESTKASSVAPVTDPENPLWNGNDRQHSKTTELTPTVGRPRSTSPKPLPFGGLNKPAQAPKPTANCTPSPFSLGAPPKLPEASVHFGTGPSSSNAPLFSGATSASSSTTSPTPSFFSLTPQVNDQKLASTEVENKPVTVPSPSPFFSFGASTATSTPSASAGGSVDAPKPLFGSSQPSQVRTENKPTSPFTFGAPTTTPSTSSAVDTIAPKPVFGSAAGVGFTFGPPPSSAPASPGLETGKSSPFAFGAAPATPPSGAERKDSFPGFGTTSTSHSGFSFGATTKPSEPVAPASAISPFAFGAPATARPITPPNGDDHGMRMEESPTREMNVNVSDKPAETGPSGGMTFGSGAASVNPFGSGGGTTGSGIFNFGATSSSSVVANPFVAKNEPANPFAPKTEDRASSPFSFNRVASAPVISTSFSFGQKSDSNTPPATAFGTASANPFGQPVSASGTSAPFSFGNPSNTGVVSNPFAPSGAGTVPNPFAPSSQTTTSAPGSPFLQNGPSFSFGGSSTGNNAFSFGNTNSQPASPAGSVSGLPASPATNNATFSFGGTAGSGGGGGALFNIGAPPPATTGRQTKALPKRAATRKR